MLLVGYFRVECVVHVIDKVILHRQGTLMDYPGSGRVDAEVNDCTFAWIIAIVTPSVLILFARSSRGLKIFY